jgi:hypothetical protein
MIPTNERPAPRSRPRPQLRPRDPRDPRRRGLSVVLVVIVLGVLIAFASLAVDIGRVRLAKVQLQTAADSAATAGASGMELFPSAGIAGPHDRAVEAAAANFSIDQRNDNGERKDAGVEVIPEEDMVFGRWDTAADPPRFVPIQASGGGFDERRQADAVRVWTRRMTQFEDVHGNLADRGNAVHLIFAPILGVEKGEVQARATAVLNGSIETAAFVGLDDVRFFGATRSDSYAAGSETYPGGGGANRNTSIATNGEVRFSGSAQIFGSVFPGRNEWIQPQPLGSGVEITGYTFPLSRPLTAVMPPFTLPTEPDAQPGTIDPPNALTNDNGFRSAKKTTLGSRPQPGGKATNFVFSNWTSNSSDVVTIDNAHSPVNIFVQGDFSHRNTAQIILTSNVHAVAFYVNGDMEIRGRGIVRPANARPSGLQVFMTRASTTLRIGGPQPLAAHVHAPGSELAFTGNGTGRNHFFGRAVGKTMTVASNVELHYDESLGPINPKFRIALVE